MMPNSSSAAAVRPSAMTVRELVAGLPAAITPAWCRQLAQSLLDDIDTRAPTRPHRIIMPDSVLADAAGHASLLASPEDDAEFQPPVTVDLKAIAAVLHFAISGESPPGGPLLLRVLPGFDEALLGAIDACLYGDRTQRPQDVAAMRRLLDLPEGAAGVVPVPAPIPAAAAAADVAAADVAPADIAPDDAMPAAAAAAVVTPPAPAAEPAPAHPPAPAVPAAPAAPAAFAEPAPRTSAATPAPPPGRSLRATTLMLACLGLAVLGIGGYALYERGRQAGAEAVLASTSATDAGALAAPSSAPLPARPAAPAASGEPATATGAIDAAPGVTAGASPGASQGASQTAPQTVQDAEPTPSQAPLPVTAANPPPAPPATRPAEAARPARPVAGSATYQLRIKPWGTVYVDGVKRGISPPLKSLTLSGEHTVRIDNPGFPSRQFTLHPGKDSTTRIEHDFD